MSIEVRLLLFAGAVLTMLYFVHNIRKKRMQIDYAIFWSLFSGGLVVLSIFPQIAIAASDLLRIHSPANLVYLVIFFALIVKLFTTTMKISKLNQQVTELTQYIALREACDENPDADQQK